MFEPPEKPKKIDLEKTSIEQTDVEPTVVQTETAKSKPLSKSKEADAKQAQPKNPLHGITLEQLITKLVDKLGWKEMGRMVKIRSFTHDPSMKSSLRFLRKTEWARTEVEALYIKTFHRHLAHQFTQPKSKAQYKTPYKNQYKTESEPASNTPNKPFVWPELDD